VFLRQWLVITNLPMKIVKTLSPRFPVSNGSVFLRCRTCNHPPNPHHRGGSPGWEGDLLARAGHQGCPLRRCLPACLPASHGEAKGDSSSRAVATQITKRSFSLYPTPASLPLSLSTALCSEIK